MSRLLARALFVAVVLLPACGSDGTTDVAVALASQPLEGNDDACAGVAAVLAAHHAAFSAHDAAAFAVTFTADARHTGPHSVTNVGAQAIQNVHTFLFSPAGPFTNPISTPTDLNVTCLRGGIATVDQDVALTGYKGLTPGLVETSPGVFRTIQRFVLIKNHGQWRIQALQLTAILPQFG